MKLTVPCVVILSLAGALGLFANLSTADAVVMAPNPADFSLTETNTSFGPFTSGFYTVTDNSPSWYVYGFTVTNPLAATAFAFTFHPDWTASNNQTLSGQPAFTYIDNTLISNQHLDFSNSSAPVIPQQVTSSFLHCQPANTCSIWSLAVGKRRPFLAPFLNPPLGR